MMTLWGSELALRCAVSTPRLASAAAEHAENQGGRGGWEGVAPRRLVPMKKSWLVGAGMAASKR